MTYARLLYTAAVLTLACGPDKGTTTGDDGTTADTTAGPTTEPTTGVTTGDDSTTGELLCSEHAEFTASWTAWQAAVAQQGATYFYTVRRSPGGFVADDYCIYRTLIAVTDGKLSERRFEVADVVGAPECEPSFIEHTAELGTHTSDFVAEPATVETLYSGCCDTVLHIEPAEDYTIEFTVDPAGLMQTCYYVANGCGETCDGGPLGELLIFETLQFGAPPAAP